MFQYSPWCDHKMNIHKYCKSFTVLIHRDLGNLNIRVSPKQRALLSDSLLLSPHLQHIKYKSHKRLHNILIVFQSLFYFPRRRVEDLTWEESLSRDDVDAFVICTEKTTLAKNMPGQITLRHGQCN